MGVPVPRTAIPSSCRCSMSRGPSTPDKAEAKLYSAAKPEFYRIYRSEQSTDVVRGPGSRPGSGRKSLLKASRSDALAAVRRLGATDRRHLGSVVYPADLPSGIVSPGTRGELFLHSSSRSSVRFRSSQTFAAPSDARPVVLCFRAIAAALLTSALLLQVRWDTLRFVVHIFAKSRLSKA